MAEPILRLENVSKRFSDFFALKSINLEMEPGEVHALIGENGSGKSSLVNILSGTVSIDSGQVYCHGRPVRLSSAGEAKKLGIAWTRQEPLLFDNFSIMENIYFDNEPLEKSFLPKTIHWPKLIHDCQILFEELNFHLDPKKLIRNIGPAQRQMVEIARAYVSNARILLMDEPTASFTEAESSALFELIGRLKKSGASILYISHRMEEIRQICDKVTVIRDGEIVGTQAVSEMDTFKLISMMSGLELKERYPKLDQRIGKEVLRISSLSSGSTLKDISFSLRKREILGITGLVGSGRTKLAKCIFGVEKIDSGTISMENRPVEIRSPLDAIRKGIAYVPEDRQLEGLFLYLSLFENMSLSSISRHIANKYVIDVNKEKNAANVLVDELSIKTDTIYSHPEELSGGNQQKVVLAKWMMSKSKLFILDEPTHGIDVASKVDVYNVMNELVRKGASIILISSDIGEVIGMCDRIAVIYEGKITAVFPREEATREKILYFATGGKNQ
jgi:ribose transport system ATP-binding protein